VGSHLGGIPRNKPGIMAKCRGHVAGLHTNYSRTTGETKTLGKAKKENPLA
jgi:hypothetical protein